jgi:hypothetical protein
MPGERGSWVQYDEIIAMQDVVTRYKCNFRRWKNLPCGLEADCRILNGRFDTVFLYLFGKSGAASAAGTQIETG